MPSASSHTDPFIAIKMPVTSTAAIANHTINARINFIVRRFYASPSAVQVTPSLTPSPPFARLSGSDAQLAYATSALAARRLLEEAGGPAVANLLRDLRDGADFEVAFERRIQKSLKEFEASLAQ